MVSIRFRIVYESYTIVNESYTIGVRLGSIRFRIVYDSYTVVYDWHTIGIRLVSIRVSLLKIFKKAADPRGGARPRGGIAKIPHSAPACLWAHLGDCQNSAFVPDWYSSRIRSHTHWHARNPVERIAQMEFSVERFAQLGISVERAWLRA